VTLAASVQRVSDLPSSLLGRVVHMRETETWSLGALGATPVVVAAVVGIAVQSEGVALIDTGCDISRIQHTGFFDRLPPILPTRAVNLMVEQPDGTYKAEPRNLYAFSISFPNTRLAPTLVEMMPWNAANLQPHDGSMTRVPVQGRAKRKQGH